MRWGAIRQAEDNILSRFKGGPGSGHYGHAGRPGQRGGSSPSSGFTAAQLSAADLTPVKEQNYKKGAFESHLVKVEDDGRAIAKPGLKSEIHNEVLAYEVAEAMGYSGLVPVTTYGKYEGRNASVQLWIENVDIAREFRDWSNVSIEDVKKIAILDAVIANQDRHTGNYLIKRNGALVAIDHGVSFGRSGSLPRSKIIYDFERLSGAKVQFTRKDFDVVRKIKENTAILNRIENSLGIQAREGFEARCVRLRIMGDIPRW